MSSASIAAANKFGAQPATANGEHRAMARASLTPLVDSFEPEPEVVEPRIGRMGRDQQMATAEAAIALMRKRAWDDFYYFAKYVVGFDKMEEQPHRELCDLLCAGITESPTLGIDCVPPNTTQQRKSLRKLILWPRGSFKSSLSSQAFPVWMLWHNPNLRILIDSETMHNAKTYLAGIRSVIEHNRMVRLICTGQDGVYALEPAYKTANGFTDDSVILATRTNANLKEPTLFCSGVDNARTGMHVDVIIMDDLVSERNVTTTQQIEKTYDHYRMSRSLLDPGGLQIVIGTRYHLSDMYGQLIDLHAKDAHDDLDSMSVTVKPAIDEDGVLLFPQRLTERFLDDQRKAQGSYIFSCNPKGAPVLMADWSFKDISEIKVGDTVIGFSRGGVGGARGDNERSQLVFSKVLGTGNKVSPVQRVVFDDGTEIRCTPDHKWFTGRRPSEKEPCRVEYLPARVGGSLHSTTQVWREQPSMDDRLAYAYLSAIIDGEGGVKHGSISITQDAKMHPGVCARIEQVLAQLNIPYKTYNKAGSDCVMYVLGGGRNTKLRLLQHGCMGKAEDVRNNLLTHMGKPFEERKRVVTIIPDGEETVYSFQTETGNYIVWGYGSKNCQYMLNPIDAGDAVFQDSDIQRYDTIPNDSIVVKYLAVDPTVTDKARSDFFVVMVVGITRDNHVYVLDYVQKKMLPREGIQTIISMYQKWATDGKLRMVGIETYAAQRALKLPLREEMKRCGVNFRIAELNHGRSSKEDHIMTKIQPICERHELHVRPHMAELINQLVEYPRVKHDDLLDGLAYAIQMMRPGGASFEKKKLAYAPVSRKTGY